MNLSGIISFIKKFITKSGLDQFIKTWLQAALDEIIRIAALHRGEPFHLWKIEVRTALKALTGQIKDNWIETLICLAYELYLKR